MTIFLAMKIKPLLLSVALLSLFSIPIIDDATALRQVAGQINLDLAPGESTTFDWGLASDKQSGQTIVALSAEGPGSEFLSFPNSVSINPLEMKFTTITVSIPENHPGDVTLTPSLIGTEAGEKGGATVINIRMLKIVTLNISQNLNPEFQMDAEPVMDEKPTEKIKTEPVVQQETNEKQTSQPLTIQQEPQMDPEPEMECGPGTELVDGFCKVVTTESGGGCLIATAAYGSELAPKVQFLREIRDNTVMSTTSGISFMTGFNQLYYSFSPTIADLERESPVFKEMVKLFITPMISSLSIMSLAEPDSEASVLGLGISVIALNLGMYIAAPAIAAREIKKRF